MKPTDVVIEKGQAIAPEISKPPTKRLAWRWKIALVTVVIGLVVGVTIGAVYFGTKAARDNFKEGWVRLETETWGFEEKVTITNHYEAEILVPGQYRVIIDYRLNLLVARTIPFGPSECFVAPFNISLLPSQETNHFLIEMDESNANDDLVGQVVVVTRTNTVASRNVMTPAAQDMCADTMSWWATASKGNSREILRERRSFHTPPTGIVFASQ